MNRIKMEQQASSVEGSLLECSLLSSIMIQGLLPSVTGTMPSLTVLHILM